MAARIAASVTCLLALALPLLGGQAAADGRARMAGGDEWDRLPARHAFKHSFKKPFFLYNTSHEIPHWEIFGSVLATPDFQRLTSSVPLQKGAIWSRLPNPHKAWQAEVAFQVSGRAYMGGDGLAFWYTKERGHAGDVLGNQDAWHGLGILFDTSDPVENRNIPFIAAVWNDGSRHLVGQRITTVANNGGCFRDFRNVGKVWMRITYANATLRLDIDMKGSGPRNYVECFTTHNFPDLPTDYYFGLTAMTSTRGYDDHDIYAFETYELYPHIDPSKLPKRPYEEEHEKKGQQFKFSEEAEKKLDQIELSEETEEEHVPEAVTAQLAKSIQETQLKIIESLNALHSSMAGNPLKNVGSAPPPGDGAAASGNLNTAILEHKIDELTSKISRTEQEISRLNEIARKVDMLVQRGDGQGQGQGQGQQRREAQECQRMMHEIQNSLRNLGSTGQPGSNRNPVTHHPSPPQSQSRSNTFWYAIIVGVIVVQALISYVWSVIRRGRGERDKKFI